jgi:DNA-binding response OmpR family regulator
MRILVIEDESKTTVFVSKALQTDGYQVDVLEDGAQAVAVPVMVS